MAGEYTAAVSSAPDFPTTLPATALVLALDAGSPTVSVAVGRGGAALAVRSVELRRSSEHLLGLLDEGLAAAGVAFAELDAVVALAGPGSFTGLRVGLATVLGFHQATGVRAAALPTLTVLALAAGQETGPVWAVVDALRGEWFAQPFALAAHTAPRALAAPAVLSTAELLAREPFTVVGFGSDRLTADFPLRRVEPAELATAALRLAALAPLPWDPVALCRPLYLREPAVSPPPPRTPRVAP